MGKGKIFVRSDLGVKVGKQVDMGTYVSPTDILCAERGKVDTPKVDVKSQDVTCAADGARMKIMSDVIGSKVSFSIEVALPKNASLGGVKSLFEASYCNAADDGAGNTALAPNLSSPVRLSIDFVERRRVTKVRDAIGTYSIQFKPGEMVYVKFDMQGTLEDVVELAPTDTDNSVPKNMLSPETDIVWASKKCQITMGTKTLIATEASMSNGVNINTEETFCGDLSDAEYIEPTVELSFRETELNEAAFADMKNGTELPVTIPLYLKDGTDAGSVAAAKCVVESPDDRGESNGYRTAKRTLSMRQTAGNDNYTIVIK